MKAELMGRVDAHPCPHPVSLSVSVSVSLLVSLCTCTWRLEVRFLCCFSGAESSLLLETGSLTDVNLSILARLTASELQ